MPDTRYGESLTLHRDVTSAGNLLQTLSYRNLEVQRKRAETQDISGSALQRSAIIEKEVNRPQIPSAAENPALQRNIPLQIGQRIDVFA